MATTDLPSRRARPRHVAVVAGLALLVVLAVVRPWPLDRPVVYSDDLFQHLALVQASDWAGSPDRTDALGAPAGVDWSVFPTGTERLHLVVLHALDAVTGDVFVALNLYVVLATVLTAVVAFVVLRWMRIGPLLAGAAAIVFTFSGAFGHRLVPGHLFLFALFPVPLGVFLALWASEPRPRPASRGAVGAAVVVVALSSAYYAAFTLVVVAGLGAAVALRRRDVRRLLAPVAVGVAIVAVAGFSLLPQLIDRADDPAADAVSRPAGDVDRFSLHVPQLFAPRPDHPVPALASLGRLARPDGRAGDAGAALGLVGAVGLVAVLVVGLRRMWRPRDGTDRTVARLAVLVVVAMAAGAGGGLGSVLADLGLTQLRAWTRIAAFIGFAALAGLALIVQRALLLRPAPATRQEADRRVALTRAAVVAVTALALVDTAVALPAAAVTRRWSQADAALVADLDERLGPEALVAQLPAVGIGDVGANRLVAPGVAAVRGGHDLRFTGGFFEGGAADWQVSWSRQPVPRMVAGLAAAGSSAVLVRMDHASVSDPAALSTGLTEVLGPPAGTADDGRWVWWDLRPLRDRLVARDGEPAVDRTGALVTRPLGVGYDDVVRLLRTGRVLGPDGAVDVRRLDGDRNPVQLSMTVAAPPGTEVVVDPPGGERRTVTVGADGSTRLSVRVVPDAASNRVAVRRADGGELSVTDVTVLDAGLADDGVLAPG